MTQFADKRSEFQIKSGSPILSNKFVYNFVITCLTRFICDACFSTPYGKCNSKQSAGVDQNVVVVSSLVPLSSF